MNQINRIGIGWTNLIDICMLHCSEVACMSECVTGYVTC